LIAERSIASRAHGVGVVGRCGPLELIAKCAALFQQATDHHGVVAGRRNQSLYDYDCDHDYDYRFKMDAVDPFGRA
jgi:hypothetical protein